MAGLIETVAIIDNQSVNAGDLLLKLDDRDYRAQLGRAEANIAARRAALASVDATRRMRVALLEQAMADLAAAMAERARAKYDIDRYRTLANDRLASRQQFERADADHEKARAAERKAQAALEAPERQLDIVDAQRAQAVADSTRPPLIVTWRASISATPKSARRSTASSAIAAPAPAPTAGRARRSDRRTVRPAVGQFA